MKCNYCKRELDYCCETTILENWKSRKTRKKPLLPHQDIYFVHHRKHGFSLDEQQSQLDKQNYQCCVCAGSRKPLVIDKQQAVNSKRLRFVCHGCLSILSKIRKYEQGKNVFKNL